VMMSILYQQIQETTERLRSRNVVIMVDITSAAEQTKKTRMRG